MPTYEDYIPDEDIVQYEEDIHKNQYKTWVEKFPDYLEAIFSSFLNLSDEPEKDDVLFFIKRGIDINKESELYKSDVYLNTPLTFACEYRKTKWIQLLLEVGASPNRPISVYGILIYPLLSVLQGHSSVIPRDASIVLQIIELLQKYGLQVKGQIPKKFELEFDNYHCDQIKQIVNAALF